MKSFRLLSQANRQMFSRRFASTTVDPAAVKKGLEAVGGRLQRVAEPLFYYSRVGVEFAAQVFKHQRLGPPSPVELAEAQQGIANFFAAFRNGMWKKVTLRETGQLLGKGLEVAGFFVVGEMIGRGNAVGYDVPGAATFYAHH